MSLWADAPDYGSWSTFPTSSFAPRQALDIFGQRGREAAESQWRAAVAVLDWQRIYIESQGRHLRHSDDPIGATCGECIKSVLLDTYDGEQLGRNIALADKPPVSEVVALSSPFVSLEEDDESRTTQPGRVADDPIAGQNHLNPALARSEPVHP